MNSPPDPDNENLIPLKTLGSSDGEHTHPRDAANHIKFHTMFANASPFRIFVLKLVRSTYFTRTMMVVVLLNIIQMCMMSSKPLYARYGWHLTIGDFILQGIYTMETLLRIYGWRRLFLSSGWNMFDLMLVLFGYIEWLGYLGYEVPYGNINIVQLFKFFHNFRVIRPVRILRSVAFFYNLQLIVSTLMRSIPAMGALAGLLVIVMYICSVIATSLFEDDNPLRFGSIGSSFMACFQLLTIDDAFTFYDDMDKNSALMGVFLVIYIIVATIVINQMLIAILLNNLQEMQEHYLNVVKNPKKNQVVEIRKGTDNLAADKRRKQESEAKYRKILDDYGKELVTSSDREKMLLLQYFMCMASLEQESHTFHNQKEVLDNLVDKLAQQE